jgi:deazaflavin-dependent oxidoreductase (nitroreductase family)
MRIRLRSQRGLRDGSARGRGSPGCPRWRGCGREPGADNRSSSIRIAALDAGVTDRNHSTVVAHPPALPSGPSIAPDDRGRGRRSGKPRTVPVGIVELDGRRFVQATYGEAGWGANLRAAGAAIITEGDRHERVQAAELPPEEAGAIIRRTLQSFRRSRLLRALLGPRARPPIGVLWRYRIRVDDTLEEYVADARRHPLFEFRPDQREPAQARTADPESIAEPRRSSRSRNRGWFRPASTSAGRT